MAPVGRGTLKKTWQCKFSGSRGDGHQGTGRKLVLSQDAQLCR